MGRCILLFGLLSSGPTLADTLVPEPYLQIVTDINAGGTRSTAGNYVLTASTGQAGSIGIVADANYQADNGFWYPAMDFDGILLLLTVNHSEWGNVEVEPNQPYYEPNTVVTLTATKIEGKTWDGWSGDVPAGDGLDNPLYLKMDTSKQISTSFKCGLGLGPFVPGILGAMCLYVWARRRA